MEPWQVGARLHGKIHLLRSLRHHGQDREQEDAAGAPRLHQRAQGEERERGDQGERIVQSGSAGGAEQEEIEVTQETFGSGQFAATDGSGGCRGVCAARGRAAPAWEGTGSGMQGWAAGARSRSTTSATARASPASTPATSSSRGLKSGSSDARAGSGRAVTTAGAEHGA